ncbi:MAG: family 10 glycosylhydrolase [Ruminococcus sp.]|nr:family 10 glycosylhydrolase [Ruminococcus sp.]
MKRVIILIALIVLCFCGCDSVLSDENETLGLRDSVDSLLDDDSGIIQADDAFFIGAWLPYMKLMPESECSDETQYGAYIDAMLENLTQVGVTDLFVQVRPFADAIYPSKLFPSCAYAAKKRGEALPFDLLSVIISCAKAHSVRVHAWINPYRIQREFDEEKLCKTETAKKWLDAGSPNVIKAAGGLYFDPASAEVQRMVLDGVRELLENYDLAGIHIDDYFYPTADESFDKKRFVEYRESGGTLNLADWRRENVSSLVSAIHSTVKAASQKKIFSISPSGDIDKDRDKMFADVELWCGQSGYCDMMIPQIYYGFENETMPFEECAMRWKNAACSDVKLVVGLAIYKAGKEDAFAGSGKAEWLKNDDVIKQQAEFLKSNHFDGFSLYSAEFVNFNETVAKKEAQNLKLWYNNTD